MVTIRQLEGERNAKTIWWYVAAVEEGKGIQAASKGQMFGVAFFDFEQAVQRSTFRLDRILCRRRLPWSRKLIANREPEGPRTGVQ